MSEKMISRRGAFSLLGLAAAVGFAVPTTVLTTSDAEAQAQPAAPAPTAPAPTATAPTATAPTAPATSGMQRRQQRRAARRTGREERREARRLGRQKRREARRTAREQRREARRGMYMQSTKPTKQQ
jgi:preprotein translocase subunit SecA